MRKISVLFCLTIALLVACAGHSYSQRSKKKMPGEGRIRVVSTPGQLPNNPAPSPTAISRPVQKNEPSIQDQGTTESQPEAQSQPQQAQDEQAQQPALSEEQTQAYAAYSYTPKVYSPQTAVQPETKDKAKDSLFVTLERTPCFGHCPSYKIEIYFKGYVVYHGYNYVDHVGDFYTVVSREKLKELFDYAKEIKYFNMQDTYINPAITDFPSTITSMQVRGQRKVIVDGHHETPSELVFFEKMIDDMFKDTQWKPLSQKNKTTPDTNGKQ